MWAASTRIRADLRKLSPASPQRAALLVGRATQPGHRQPGPRRVRRAGGPAVLAVPEVRAAQRLFQHRAPRQLAGLRVQLRIRRFDGARRGRRRHGQRPTGHALRGDRQPLRALRGGDRAPAGKPAALLRALRGHGPVAREPRGRDRRPRPPDHPVEHVPAGPGRPGTTRADRRGAVLLGGALRSLARHGAGREGDCRDPGPLRWPRDLRPVHRPRQRLRLDGADLHADAADADRQRRRDPPRSAGQLELDRRQ